MLLPVSPDVLHRVQLRRVRRQIAERQAPLLGGDEVPDQTTAMGLQRIPDHEDGARKVAQEMGQELGGGATGWPPVSSAVDGGYRSTKVGTPKSPLAGHGAELDHPRYEVEGYSDPPSGVGRFRPTELDAYARRDCLLVVVISPPPAYSEPAITIGQLAATSPSKSRAATTREAGALCWAAAVWTAM
jgi:hypothetical protein